MAEAAARSGATRRARIALIASRFNPQITESLVQGAREALAEHGVAASNVSVTWVPGAFELPVAAACVAASARPEAIVALGCLIKGQTAQYLAIAQAVAHGLVQVSLETKIPVTFGVIVAESMALAKARAGGSVGNRGREAALAAVAMVDVTGTLGARTPRAA